MAVKITLNPELGEDVWSLTGERDEEYGSIELVDESGLTHWVVDWGVGNGHQARFDSLKDAKMWVGRHQAEIADGESVY